jgi:hypothetical protein
VGCKADFSSAELMAPFTPPETPASVQVACAPDVISSSPLISSVGPSTNTPGPGPVLSKQRVSSSTVTGSATSRSLRQAQTPIKPSLTRHAPTRCLCVRRTLPAIPLGVPGRSSPVLRLAARLVVAAAAWETRRCHLDPRPQPSCSPTQF